MPVLIVAAYDENDKPNAMNAAWGGIFSDNMVGICLADNHKTTKNILYSKAFTVSIATEELTVKADYLGIVSGNNVDNKLLKANLNHTKSEFVNAPVMTDFPFTLECELVSYDADSNYMIGRIINVSADDSILSDNKIDIEKLKPITYDPVNHNYYVIGRKVGNAFSDGKKI